MFLFPTTTEEVTEVCKTLAKKPSKGKDGIPTNILLNSITELGDILANCINSSFEQGSFPKCLKGAIVIPLHKKNSKNDPSNYRPVSLLNSLSKIIEKVIHTRLYEYMKDKICKNQFGFRPKHSTTDLLIMTIEGIVRNLWMFNYFCDNLRYLWRCLEDTSDECHQPPRKWGGVGIPGNNPVRFPAKYLTHC